MGDGKYPNSKRLVLLVMTVLITTVTMVLIVDVFFRRPFLNLSPLFLLLMFLTFLSSVLLLRLDTLPKIKPIIFNEKMDLLDVRESKQEDKTETDDYKSLKEEIDEIKSLLPSIGLDDVEYFKIERSKKMVLSKLRYNTRRQKESMQIVLNSFKKPMQFVLYLSVIVAGVGLMPLLYLIFQGNSINSDASVTVIIASRWPFLALTLVVEFVAGILLKIYYKMIDEVKYYMKEDVNLTEKKISIETLVCLNRFDCIDSILLKMQEKKDDALLQKTVCKKSDNAENDNLSKILSVIEAVSKQK